MTKTLTKKLANKEHAAVVTYIMGGDGGLDNLEEQLLFLEKSGVSAIEIGIPFSDPVADGPVIQLAGLRAFEQKNHPQTDKISPSHYCHHLHKPQSPQVTYLLSLDVVYVLLSQ